MPRGGARSRSGPQPDPSSGRSERRGFRLDALPVDGYEGGAPEFPIPSNAQPRVITVWEELWGTPQAAAWAVESWRWPIVAMYAVLRVRIEDPDSPAALIPHCIRLGDQIGMTPAGLKENGWAIAKPAGAESEADGVEASESATRLRVVGSAG